MNHQRYSVMADVLLHVLHACCPGGNFSPKLISVAFVFSIVPILTNKKHL